ncbi:MAG: DUF1801 domain-containing protein [Alphaproteobacteria bacterium]|nr:DUF1801 domain-containing protein [Alphaproteobacteria bacterium]
MARNDNQTVPTGAAVDAFLDAVEHPVRQADARAVCALMQDVSGCAPRMWGPSIVGFGQYHYRYDSGREGDFMRIGFSPRKANLVLYIMPGFEGEDELMAALGKHKIGKSCLYINKLSDVDPGVLRSLCEKAWATMAERYPDDAGRD